MDVLQLHLPSCKTPDTTFFLIPAYQNQSDPYGAGQSPVQANPENAMSNLSAFMMQSGIIPSQQQQQPNSHGEAAAAELSSLPNLLVESGDLTQGDLTKTKLASPHSSPHYQDINKI